ncbi:MAG: DUF721 domain-containing protein [Bacteroidetes bacterium]|nr:DUF721 domain-containing protein [Bacteroidota bacterium]
MKNIQLNNNIEKSDAVSIKEAVNDMLQTYNIKDKFNQTHIIASWERLMGKPIAKRTTKIFIKEKVMFVELTSAPLKQELSLSKTKILQILNNEAGENLLEDIVFI